MLTELKVLMLGETGGWVLCFRDGMFAIISSNCLYHPYERMSDMHTGTSMHVCLLCSTTTKNRAAHYTKHTGG